MLTKRKGNLIVLADQGEFEVIVQDCNCFCIPSGTINNEIKNRWPSVFAADLETIAGDKSKLGKFTFAQVMTLSGKPLIVVNAYTQFALAKHNERVADYQAIQEVFGRIAQFLGSRKIAYPAIGTGLAHGDWNVIAPIIHKELFSCDQTFVEYEKPKLVNA